MLNLEKKIIVSADDFGKNENANKNILELMTQNKLQRISVMVDGKLSPEEIRLLLDCHIKLDLHLTLYGLRENSLNYPKEIGVLSRLWFFSRDYLLGKISISKVEQNWMRQLEKFYAIFQKYPDGLSSHEHIHFFPPYCKLILALARKTKIGYLRFGKKDFFQITNPITLIIFLLRKINRRKFLDAGLSSADFLVSLDWLKKDGLRKIKNLPQGEIELLIHPEKPAELEFIKTHTLV